MKNDRYNLTTIWEGIQGIILIALCILLSPFIRKGYSKWGTTPSESEQSLPGDPLVVNPKTSITCAIDIKSSGKLIWPWLLQLGKHYQHLNAEDLVLTTIKKMSFQVDTIDKCNSISLRKINTNEKQAAGQDNLSSVDYIKASLCFVIEGLDEGSCRLIYRRRIDWNPGIINTLYYRILLEPISFVMARKMLIGIKKRAENIPGDELHSL